MGDRPRRHPKREPGQPYESMKSRSKPKPRQLLKLPEGGVETAAYRPVGGEQGVSENNELTALIFGGPMFNLYYRGYTAEDINSRFFFVPLIMDPSQPNEPQNGRRPPNSDLIEDVNIFTVSIEDKKFTTGNILPTLVARVPNARSGSGYSNQKINYAANPSATPGSGKYPYYYIYRFDPGTNSMVKVWGQLPVMPLQEAAPDEEELEDFDLGGGAGANIADEKWDESRAAELMAGLGFGRRRKVSDPRKALKMLNLEIKYLLKC